MEQAIEAKSFHPIFGKKMETIKNTKDIHNELISCHTVIESMVRSGAQEHFYMESNCCLAGNYLIISIYKYLFLDKNNQKTDILHRYYT